MPQRTKLKKSCIILFAIDTQPHTVMANRLIFLIVLLVFNNNPHQATCKSLQQVSRICVHNLSNHDQNYHLSLIIILIIEAYMDSTLGCIGVVKKKIVSGICSEDTVTVSFLLWLPQNLVLFISQLLLLFLAVRKSYHTTTVKLEK